MLSGEPTLFQWAGGLPALTRMTRLLYEKHVPADDLLAPVFAGMAPGHPQREAMWLAEVFGGPAWYSQRFGGEGGPAGACRRVHQRAAGTLGGARRARCRRGQAARRPGVPRRARRVPGVGLAGAVPRPAEPGMPTSPAALGLGTGRAARRGRHRAGDTGSRPPRCQGPGEAVSFEAHVKPLFRARDRQSMLFAFDLWSPADVQAHAADILARLRGGTMPCDGAWPGEKTDVLKRWAESGFRP